MQQHVHASHRIHLGLPPDDCLRLFTPADEERWVDGWRPRYVPPQRVQGASSSRSIP